MAFRCNPPLIALEQKTIAIQIAQEQWLKLDCKDDCLFALRRSAGDVTFEGWCMVFQKEKSVSRLVILGLLLPVPESIVYVLFWTYCSCVLFGVNLFSVLCVICTLVPTE